MNEQHADFLVVGGGIAAASAGYWLAPHGRVILLERESQPGYHSTGRSAALFYESYGTPQVRSLTMASRAFLANPPDGFSEHPLMTPRGALTVAAPGQEGLLDAHWEVLRPMTKTARRVTTQQACELFPVLRPEQVAGGIHETDPMDMDVHAIHQGYLRGLRRAGGQVFCDAEVTRIARAGNTWQLEAGGNLYEAPVVLNAAGAWADKVGEMAGASRLGLQPKRRSAFIFAAPQGASPGNWPMAVSAGHDWYIKPDAGMLLGSPANADPVEPHDVQAEEMDIAIAIDRIQAATTLEIRRPTRVWAGLRSFVPDGDLVGGFDPRVPGFFWVAGQGGYGIQTSAAMGEACAALARGENIPARIAAFGLTAQMLGPGRLGAL